MKEEDYIQLRGLEEKDEDKDPNTEEKEEHLTVEGVVVGYGRLGDPVVQIQDHDVLGSQKAFSKKFEGEENLYPTPGDRVKIRINDRREHFSHGVTEEIVERSSDTKGDLAVDILDILEVDKVYLNTNSKGTPNGIRKAGFEKVREKIVGLKRELSSAQGKIKKLENTTDE